MAKYMGNAQKVWIEGIQTRVDVTASMLSSMKVRKIHTRELLQQTNTCTKLGCQNARLHQ